ncbi:MAG: hypothetical protein V1709_07035 [Planctomycetota bacterium]
MKVLVACEFSQVVCKAFRDKGHESYSCDLLPTEGNPEWHIQCDIRELLRSKFIRTINLLIAHDPCTYQCNSGVRWLHEIPGRWDKLRKSCELTKEIINASVDKISRENPIPHKYAVELIGVDYTQCVQPHWFIGSNESKATCLWLKGLPKLKRTQWLDKTEVKQSVFLMSPSDNRGKERSRFPVSIANAMAEQWG